MNTYALPISPAPLAVVGNRLCTDLLDVTNDLGALDSEGFWAVVLPYDGVPVCARFATIRSARPWTGPRWRGPAYTSWTSSLDEDRFRAGVDTIRAAVGRGDVYQVNLTRRLSAPLHDLDEFHLIASWFRRRPAEKARIVRP